MSYLPPNLSRFFLFTYLVQSLSYFITRGERRNLMGPLAGRPRCGLSGCPALTKVPMSWVGLLLEHSPRLGKSGDEVRGGAMVGMRQPEDLMVETALTAHEALRLMGQVNFGRVVFTSRAMPAVRPVRHVVAGDQIIIAVGPELVLGSPSATTPAGSGGETIVAYEADQLDATGCSGWSVVVVGRARPITTGAEARLYRHLLPAKTVPDQLVAISADVVNGFRLGDSRETLAALPR